MKAESGKWNEQIGGIQTVVADREEFYGNQITNVLLNFNPI